MYEIKRLILLKYFKENNINIDDITIDKIKNVKMYYVTFWYNKKVVSYSYKMGINDIEHYLNGISLAYSYEWKNNH